MDTTDLTREISAGQDPLGASGGGGQAGPVRNAQQEFWSTYIRQGTPLEERHRKLAVPGYELLCILGKGGMGTVFLARQPHLNRLVAIKMLNPDHAHDPVFIDMIRREARTMGALSHPNIVSCHDIVANEGGIFLVMEFIPGHLTCRDLVARFGPLPERIVIGILLEVVRGLNYIQSKGITHKDLKPDNILFCWDDEKPPESLNALFEAPESRVTICDFGIADQRPYQAGKARGRRVLGSPAYMSPEQILQEETVGRSSDIYSLGATAYYLLTGKPPYQDLTPEQCFHLKCTEPLALPRETARRLHSDFVQVVNRMGEPHPLDRYRDYDELRRDLSALEVRYGGLHKRRKNYRERYKGVVLGILFSLFFLFCLYGGACSYYMWRSSRKSHNLPRNLSFLFWKGEVDSWKIIQDHQDFAKSILIGFARNKAIRLRQDLPTEEYLDFAFRLLGNGSCLLEVLDQDGDARGAIRLLRKSDTGIRFQFSVDGRDMSIEDPPDFPQMNWTRGTIALDPKRIKLYLDSNLVALGHFRRPVRRWNLRLSPGTAQMLQVQSMFIMDKAQRRSFLNYLIHPPEDL